MVVAGRVMGVVVALVAALSLGGCARQMSIIQDVTQLGTSDEEKIAAVINDVHRGMESRRIYRVLAHVSRDYRDANGRDYAAMEAYFNDLFKRYREIRIKRERPKIAVQGDRAQVLEIYGTTGEAVIPGSSDIPMELQGQVSMILNKEGNDWRIIQWGNRL